MRVYITRQLEQTVIKASGQYPVVMVCGQRQTGKSTMLRHISTDERRYVTFDDYRARSLARNDPEQFFEYYGHKLFIDEFQRVPEILLEIKKIVDEAQYGGGASGMFWLSGSQKFEMMKNITETLAGRTAIFSLLPLSCAETEGRPPECFLPEIEALRLKPCRGQTVAEIFDKIFMGGLPQLVTHPEMDRDVYYSSYISTYIERDIAALEQVGKLEEFRAFMIYLAANTAQELKYDSAAKVVGVSAPTIKEWVSILVRSGIIYLLKPYSSNISKRLVKTPKCYFLDTGLAAYLTSWPGAQTLMNGSAAGAFFETYVVAEILKSYYNAGKEPPVYYYRDTDKREVDLLIKQGDRLYPIEIKTAKNPQNADKNFDALDKLGLKVCPGLIICSANEMYPVSKRAWLCPVSLI